MIGARLAALIVLGLSSLPVTHAQETGTTSSAPATTLADQVGGAKAVEREKTFQEALDELRATAKSREAGSAPKRMLTPRSGPLGFGDRPPSDLDRIRSVGDALRRQILAKGCWTDHDDMADARRLRAVLSAEFGMDGHLVDTPRLVEPTAMPSDDPPLQAFIQRARMALEKCNVLGFQIPLDYFAMNSPRVEFEFLPGR